VDTKRGKEGKRRKIKSLKEGGRYIPRIFETRTERNPGGEKKPLKHSVKKKTLERGLEKNES